MFVLQQLHQTQHNYANSTLINNISANLFQIRKYLTTLNTTLYKLDTTIWNILHNFPHLYNKSLQYFTTFNKTLQNSSKLCKTVHNFTPLCNFVQNTNYTFFVLQFYILATELLHFYNYQEEILCCVQYSKFSFLNEQNTMFSLSHFLDKIIIFPWK